MRVRYRYVTYTAEPAAEQQDLERLRLFHELWHLRQRTMLPAGEWRPPMDVFETPDQITVKLEVAGVAEDDIHITLYADHLVVGGIRQDPEPAGEQSAYHEAGIHYGAFRAEVRLPRTLDAEKVTANLESGFLTIHLPRATARVE